jgi:hypothetical protein
MTQRLPTPGGDTGSWGTVLNGFLGVSLNSDGTMLPSAVATAAEKVSVQTSSYGPGASQSEIVLANATSANLTVTLPTAASNIFNYTVKKTDSSTHTVTLATTSSQTIDGGTTAVIRVQYASITVVSDGSNWSVV